MSNSFLTFQDKCYDYAGGVPIEQRGLTIGGHGSAFLADLVGAYIMEKTSDCFKDAKHRGIYRDDGFVVFDGKKSKNDIIEWLADFQSKVDKALDSSGLQFTADIWGEASPEDANSDVVSIHARVTKETVNLIGKKEISLMKKDSYLINTARGPLLDYKALHDALSNGKLKGAALDTFYEEPLPENHIFKNLNNVTITPHIAGASVKTAYYAAEVIAKDVRNYIDGKKLVNRIC